jgi:hypothetical protein
VINSLARRLAIVLCLAAGSLGMSSAAPAPQRTSGEAAPPVPPAPTAGSKTLEDLLKETSFVYKKLKDGVFKVVAEGPDGETSVIILQEKTAPWKNKDGSPIKYVMLYTSITPAIPKEQKLPPAMLSRLAELNDRLDLGNLGLNVGENGQWVFYSAGFYLRQADSNLLEDYITMAHYRRLLARKELLPFLQQISPSGGQ